MPEIKHKKLMNFMGITSFQAFAMFRRGLFYTYLSIYLKFFLGLSVSETTLFATLPMLMNIIFQTFVWGPLADKLQIRRTLVIVGEVIASVLTVLVWWTHTLPVSDKGAGYVVIIGLSVVEIFWSMSNVGWSALLADLYTADERTGIQGKLSSIGALTRFVGVWVGGFMYDGMSQFYEGWGFHTGPLFFFAAVTMAISVIPVLFLPEGGTRSFPVAASANISNIEIKGISKQFGIFLLAMAFIHFGTNSMSILRSQYLSLEGGFNLSSSLLGHIVNTESAAIFVMGLMVKRLSKKFSDFSLLASGTVMAMMYLLGFMAARNISVIFASAFVGGLSWVLIVASSFTYASRLIPPEKRGKHFAIFNATFFLSWGLPATFITGPLVDFLIKKGSKATFAYRASFLVASLIVASGLVTLFVMNRKKPSAETVTVKNQG